MARKKGSNGDNLISGILGVIGTTLVEETLLVPPRLEKARKEGYNQGYTARDRELQPIIRRCENERELLQRKHAEQQRTNHSLNLEIERLDKENSRLKEENEKLKPKATAPKLN